MTRDATPRPALLDREEAPGTRAVATQRPERARLPRSHRDQQARAEAARERHGEVVAVLRGEVARDALQVGQYRQPALVADPANRQHRIVLERPFEPGDVHDRLQRVGGLVFAERLDEHGTEEVVAAHDQAGECLPHLGIGAVGGQRAQQRGPDELGDLAVERSEQARNDAEILVLLGAWQKYPVLTIFAASGVILTAGYLLWTIQRVYLGSPNEKYLKLPEINGREMFTLVPLGAIVIIVGVYPNVVLDMLRATLDQINQIVVPHL